MARDYHNDGHVQDRQDRPFNQTVEHVGGGDFQKTTLVVDKTQPKLPLHVINQHHYRTVRGEKAAIDPLYKKTVAAVDEVFKPRSAYAKDPKTLRHKPASGEGNQMIVEAKAAQAKK